MNKPDKRALSTLLEQPESFNIETMDGTQKTLFMYPFQLGRLAMISQRLIDLDLTLMDKESDVVQKMWQVCADKPRKVAEIIALATLRTKQEVDEQLETRADELLWSPSMDTQAYSNLLYIIIFQSYYADFLSAIRSVRTLRVTISQPTAAERIAPMEDAVFGDR
ncbi:MAG: hypothetical protein HFJ82_03165 [Alistipes sp.]|jgi:hypothetical protein|uniref:hypothetical protein n=1 Tax=uncultured Alistipes sp. TaxID=538949 RepID=UPI0025989E98|nr:hypothetical protein [uncultured Alistipes sp.]MCI9244492.1 hypothetical protein [Alistipes sp.]